jgi:hypothetical protein
MKESSSSSLAPSMGSGVESNSLHIVIVRNQFKEQQSTEEEEKGERGSTRRAVGSRAHIVFQAQTVDRSSALPVDKRTKERQRGGGKTGGTQERGRRGDSKPWKKSFCCCFCSLKIF